LICFNILTASITIDAQILGGFMNEAKRKLERKIEDKIIQAVSDELAQRAFKPIDQAIDSMMRKKYQDSINNGQPFDHEIMGEDYTVYLNSVNLAEKYTFDVTQEVENIDYSKKKKLYQIVLFQK